MEEKYIYLDVDPKGALGQGDLSVQIKMEGEGVVVSVYDDSFNEIATTWKTYAEMDMEVVHVDRSKDE